MKRYKKAKVQKGQLFKNDESDVSCFVCRRRTLT